MFIDLLLAFWAYSMVVYELRPFTQNLSRDFLCKVQLALVPGLRVGFFDDDSSSRTPVAYQNPVTPPQDQDTAPRRAARANPVQARMRIQGEIPYIEIHLFHINLYKYAFQCAALFSGFLSADFFLNDLSYTKRTAVKLKAYFSGSEPKTDTPSIKEMQDEVSNGYKTTTTASTTEIPKEVPPGPVGGG